MQYLSLILIILVFTIGAFLRGKKINNFEVVEEELAYSETEKKEDTFVKTKLSSMRYENLFLLGGTTINHDIAEALVTFLKNHDVECEIVLSPENDSEAEYDLALGRALVLATYLESQNIPRNSWHVITAELSQGAQAIVKLVGVKDKNELL